MTRLNLVLLMAVLASALYLVRTQYESRRLFAEIDRASNQARKLELEHERLRAEKRAQATPLRVEKLAKEQLQMRVASPAITQYVSIGTAGAGQQGAKSPASGGTAALAAGGGTAP